MKSFFLLFAILLVIASSCNCEDEIIEEIEEISCNCLDKCASNYNATAEGYDECFYGDKFDPREYSRFFNSKTGIFMDLQISASKELEFIKKETIEEDCNKKVIYSLKVISENDIIILETELTSSGPNLHAPNNTMNFDSVYFKEIDIPFAAECIGYWENKLCDRAFNWTANCECTVTNPFDGTTIKDSIQFNLFK